MQVSFLFEHKSANQPRETYFQLLRYMVEIWDLQKKQNLPRTPIMPIIVYHGKVTWGYETFESPFPGLPKHFSRFVPQFPSHVTDLSAITDEELHGSGSRIVKNTFLAMKHIRDKHLSGLATEYTACRDCKIKT